MGQRRMYLFALALLCPLACAHGKSAEEELQAQKPNLPEPAALSIFQPPLWERFVADKAHPRLLVFASPTDSQSLHGLSVVQREVLVTAPRTLRTYVIWTPVLEDDDRIASTAASGMLGDEQAAQFWDEGGKLAAALGAVLRIPSPGLARDVYVLYAPGADAAAPPYLWMQQLPQVRATQAPKLNGKLLRARIDELVPPGQR